MYCKKWVDHSCQSVRREHNCCQAKDCFKIRNKDKKERTPSGQSGFSGYALKLVSAVDAVTMLARGYKMSNRRYASHFCNVKKGGEEFIIYICDA